MKELPPTQMTEVTDAAALRLPRLKLRSTEVTTVTELSSTEVTEVELRSTEVTELPSTELTEVTDAAALRLPRWRRFDCERCCCQFRWTQTDGGDADDGADGAGDGRCGGRDTSTATVAVASVEVTELATAADATRGSETQNSREHICVTCHFHAFEPWGVHQSISVCKTIHSKLTELRSARGNTHIAERLVENNGNAARSERRMYMF